MNQKWEIKRVSTPKRIFDKINYKVPPPVGIVIFGVDCEFKNQITDVFRKGVKNRIYKTASTLSRLRDDLVKHPGANVVVESGQNNSLDHTKRHIIVSMLRDVGMVTMVGIYVEPNALNDSKMEAARRALADNPPTCDGLDYLITIREEEE